MKLLRTNSDNVHFQILVKSLDEDLAIRDGDEHSFFSQYNKIDAIKYVVLLYVDGAAVSCGAIKEYDANTMELKRMYTLPSHRAKGYASLILKELELWALELGYANCILETGLKMPEAIRVYQKNGYVKIPNYGQYIGVESSVCFSKNLIEL